MTNQQRIGAISTHPYQWARPPQMLPNLTMKPCGIVGVVIVNEKGRCAQHRSTQLSHGCANHVDWMNGTGTPNTVKPAACLSSTTTSSRCSRSLGRIPAQTGTHTPGATEYTFRGRILLRVSPFFGPSLCCVSADHQRSSSRSPHKKRGFFVIKYWFQSPPPNTRSPSLEKPISFFAPPAIRSPCLVISSRTPLRRSAK